MAAPVITEKEKQTLADVPAAELARYSRKLIHISLTTTLDEALELLHQQNILSVPVFNDFSKSWVGILTIQDILAYVAFKDFADGKLSKDFDNGTKPAGNIIQEREEPTPIAAVSDTVADVLEPLCKGLHRMLVRLPHAAPIDEEDAEGEVEEKEAELRLITQSDVIKCGLLLDDVADWEKTLNDLDMVQGKVHSIKATDTAIMGFEKMGQEEVSALAVVSEVDGKLVSTLSASDLRGLTSNVIHRVVMPVTQFIKEHKHGRITKPITVTVDATLREAVNKMMWGRVHRVWIVDEHGWPMGVVTSTDIVRHMFDHHQANHL